MITVPNPLRGQCCNRDVTVDRVKEIFNNKKLKTVQIDETLQTEKTQQTDKTLQMDKTNIYNLYNVNKTHTIILSNANLVTSQC